MMSFNFDNLSKKDFELLCEYFIEEEYSNAFSNKKMNRDFIAKLRGTIDYYTTVFPTFNKALLEDFENSAGVLFEKYFYQSIEEKKNKRKHKQQPLKPIVINVEENSASDIDWDAI